MLLVLGNSLRNRWRNKLSKPTKRKCPQCGEVKLFRADQKTCGCPRPGSAPKADLLAGRYFRSAPDEDGEYTMGRIVSRISPSMYLVAFNDLLSDGEEYWQEKIVPLADMRDWDVSDKGIFDIWFVLRGMEADEAGKS